MNSVHHIIKLTTIALIIIPTLYSCHDDKPPEPNISFKSGEGYVAGDQTVKTGERINFVWTVKKGNSNIDEFSVYLNDLDAPKYRKTDINAEVYTDSISELIKGTGILKYTFHAIDDRGYEEKTTITLTISGSYAIPKEWTGKIIEGALEDGSNKSLFSVETGKSYASDNITVNDKAMIDIVYAYADNDSVFTDQLISPDSVPYTFHAGKTLPNTTYFEESNSTDFSKITSADITALSGLFLNNIAIYPNDVVAFITQEGHKGYIKIKQVNGGTGGPADYVQIDVKYLLASDLK